MDPHQEEPGPGQGAHSLSGRETGWGVRPITPIGGLGRVLAASAGRDGPRAPQAQTACLISASLEPESLGQPRQTQEGGKQKVPNNTGVQ